MKERSHRLTRVIFVGGGLLFLALTAGFFAQLSWATALWPWPDGRLSYIFLASITAAIALPLIWIGLSGEYGAAQGGAINLGIAAAGIAVHLFRLYLASREFQLLVTAIIATSWVPLNAAIFIWSRRFPIMDERAMPRPVKLSFILFTTLLVLVAGGLLSRAPNIFPWPLKPDSSVLFGMIFLGAAFYFAAGLRSNRWHGAKGQLLGFLAYDLILIGPFIGQFSKVQAEHRLSLTLYTIVLLYSGSLAVFYLFLARETGSAAGGSRAHP
jgi:hypothetical protein